MTSSTHPPSHPPSQLHNSTPEPETGQPRRWLGLAILLLATAIEMLDTTIVNVAIPSIEHDLGATASQIEWVVAGYILAFAVLLITGGRLGDAFGRRRIFLIGIAGFTLMSLGCGLAQSPEQLIAARAAQGAFAAAMIPQVLASIRGNFPDSEHPKAYGLYGAVLGLATVSGPLIGGVLVDANLWDLAWRPIFLVNVPIGVLAIGGALAFIPESTGQTRQRLDLAGVVLLTAGLLLVTYPLVQGASEPWTTTRVAILLSAAPVLAVFGMHQHRRTRAAASPLLPLDLFRQRGFSGGFAVALVFFSGVAGFFLALTITLQRDLGFTPLRTGLSFLPWSLGIFVASGIAVNLVERLGKSLVIVGNTLMVIGMTVLYRVVAQQGADLSSSDLILGLTVAGLGMGAVAPTLIDVVLRGVGLSDAGAASGVMNTALQLGGAIGIAIIGYVFFTQQSGPLALVGGSELTGMRAVLLTCIIGDATSLLLATLLLPGRRAGD